MGGILEKRAATQSGKATGPKVSDKVRALFPTLSTLMEGAGEPGDPGFIPPFALTLFAVEGGIRFALSAKATGEAWFGTAGGAEDVLGSVEAALARGEVEAKQEKGSKAKAVF